MEAFLFVESSLAIAVGLVALVAALRTRSRVEHVAAVSGMAVVREKRRPELFRDELLNELRLIGTAHIHLHDIEVVSARVLKRVR